MKVKPRNAKVFGLLTPRFLRLTAARRPNSITRVLTGWSDSENAANRSRIASRKRRGNRGPRRATQRLVLPNLSAISRGALYLMLQNRIYRGEIVHKEQ